MKKQPDRVHTNLRRFRGSLNVELTKTRMIGRSGGAKTELVMMLILGKLRRISGWQRLTRFCAEDFFQRRFGPEGRGLLVGQTQQ